jgi:hypothetical protein
MGRFGLDFAFDAQGASRGGLRCDYSLYTNGTNTFKVRFVESPQLEAISTIDSFDVMNGQIPKLNTETDITVEYYNLSGVLVSDTEAVTLHEFATTVEITRGNSTRKYSHKTGDPIADLLYYRNNAGQVVYFDGDYTIPLTVSSPVTLGYSIANGNVSGSVTQQFTAELTENSNNSITIPDFTDNWGNSLTGRQYNVVYGEVLFTFFDNPEAIILQNGEGANPETFDNMEAVILQNGGL